jgi:tetratricopeptide (TPR) repeat protein
MRSCLSVHGSMRSSKVRRLPHRMVLLALGFSALVPSPAAAQSAASSSGTLNEARDRFDQGLKLFNEGNFAGAMAEFKRVNELAPNPVVLYNIGLVYAEMGRPVEAVDALEQVVGSESGLGDADRLRATEVHKEQSRRVGELTLDGMPKDSVVEVDGIQIGRAPLTRPLRLTVGAHVLTVIAEGHHPFKREVVLAGGERRNLSVELTAVSPKTVDVPVERRVELRIESKPTPEIRENYMARYRRQRNWGWAAVATGASVGIGSGLFLAYDAKKIDDAQRAYDDVVYLTVEHSGRRCDVYAPAPNFDRAACDAELSTRYDDIQKWRHYRTVGWIGVGVGGALVATGLVLLLTNDDPVPHDQPSASHSRRLELRPLATLDSRYQWLGVQGRF